MHTRVARRIVRESIKAGGQALCHKGGKVRVDASFAGLSLAAACLVCLEIMDKAARTEKKRGGGRRRLSGDMITRALAFHPTLAAHVAEPCPGAPVGVATVA